MKNMNDLFIIECVKKIIFHIKAYVEDWRIFILFFILRLSSIIIVHKKMFRVMGLSSRKK